MINAWESNAYINAALHTYLYESFIVVLVLTLERILWLRKGADGAPPPHPITSTKHHTNNKLETRNERKNKTHSEPNKSQTTRRTKHKAATRLNARANQNQFNIRGFAPEWRREDNKHTPHQWWQLSIFFYNPFRPFRSYRRACACSFPRIEYRVAALPCVSFGSPPCCTSAANGRILMHLACASLLCHFSGAHHSLCVDHRYDTPFKLLRCCKISLLHRILLMLSCACYSFDLVVLVVVLPHLIRWLLDYVRAFNVNMFCLASISFYCSVSQLQASAYGRVYLCAFYIPFFE